VDPRDGPHERPAHHPQPSRTARAGPHRGVGAGFLNGVTGPPSAWIHAVFALLGAFFLQRPSVSRTARRISCGTAATQLPLRD